MKQQLDALIVEMVDKGINAPPTSSAGRLFEIAKRLETDVSFFFDGVEPDDESKPLAHGGKNRSTIELVRNFNEIEDPAVRSAVTGLLTGSVAVCVKHWPGHGGSDRDTHRDAADAGDRPAWPPRAAPVAASGGAARGGSV